VEPRFRRLKREDFPLLSDWFSRPNVEPWWREAYDAGSIERKYGPSVDGLGPTELFVIETEGSPIGFIQRYLLDENTSWKASLAPTGEHEKAVGIDYLIGDEVRTGMGLGPQIIGAFVGSTWCRPPASWDHPSANNMGPPRGQSRPVWDHDPGPLVSCQTGPLGQPWRASMGFSRRR
jgi:hypothetical protein